jgi:hypothetical protein
VAVTTSVDSKMAHLAEVLADQIGKVVNVLHDRMAPELPAWMLEPEMRQASREFSRASILIEWDHLRQGARIPEVCPEVDAQGARDSARAGLPLATLLRGYRLSHSVQWEAWFRLVEEQESDQPERRELIERGSAFFFAYADQLSGFVTEVFTQERDAMLRDREQRRMYLVRELLGGGSVEPAELDYDVAGHHIGLVAWGPQAAAAMNDLARRLDRRLLLVLVAADIWWGWLGGKRPTSAGAHRELERYAPPDGTRLALGEEAAGPEGFRNSHRQALRAQRVAASSTDPSVRYDDVALEALASTDEDEARAFVERELAGLLSDDRRSANLRETLRSYFAHGHNAAATAADLGVHEQTVALRLQAVEERTGRGVIGRRAELETALRLRRCLPDDHDETEGPDASS